MGYERNGIFAARKTKPKQSQFAGVLKMKVSSALTRSYGDMAALTARQNKPKQSQFRYLLCSRPSPHLLIDCGFLNFAGKWFDTPFISAKILRFPRTMREFL